MGTEVRFACAENGGTEVRFACAENGGTEVRFAGMCIRNGGKGRT